MTALYKYTEIYEKGKLTGEIFTEYPTKDLIECCCMVGNFEKNSVEIENVNISYYDTEKGLEFDEELIEKMDEIFDFWNNRKKTFAGWISRGSPQTGMIGCDYSKPGSDEWVFIEKKQLNEKNIEKKSKKETIDDFFKIQEEYIDDELFSESYKLKNGTIMKLERNQIGLKHDKNGLIIREYERETFKEIINLWKKRRDNYENKC